MTISICATDSRRVDSAFEFILRRSSRPFRNDDCHFVPTEIADLGPRRQPTGRIVSPALLSRTCHKRYARALQWNPPNWRHSGDREGAGIRAVVLLVSLAGG